MNGHGYFSAEAVSFLYNLSSTSQTHSAYSSFTSCLLSQTDPHLLHLVQRQTICLVSGNGQVVAVRYGVEVSSYTQHGKSTIYHTCCFNVVLMLLCTTQASLSNRCCFRILYEHHVLTAVVFLLGEWCGMQAQAVTLLCLPLKLAAILGWLW